MNLNFQFTEQIKRYMDEMISYWNECKLDMPKSKIKFAEPLEIKTYLEKEMGNDKDEENRLNFTKWLEKENAVQFIYHTEDAYHQFSEGKNITYPETFHVQVKDIAPIISIYNAFTNTRLEKEDDGRKLFFNEGTGEFEFGKYRKVINMERDRQYYKILLSIYLGSGGDGEVSLLDINKMLKRNYPKTQSLGKRQVQYCINSTIKNKLMGLVPNSSQMVRWERGKNKVFFDNPKM